MYCLHCLQKGVITLIDKKNGMECPHCKWINAVSKDDDLSANPIVFIKVKLKDDQYQFCFPLVTKEDIIIIKKNARKTGESLENFFRSEIILANEETELLLRILDKSEGDFYNLFKKFLVSYGKRKLQLSSKDKNRINWLKHSAKKFREKLQYLLILEKILRYLQK